MMADNTMVMQMLHDIIYGKYLIQARAIRAQVRGPLEAGFYNQELLLLVRVICVSLR